MNPQCCRCKKDITTSHQRGLCTSCLRKEKRSNAKAKIITPKKLDMAKVIINVLENVLAEGDRHAAQFGVKPCYHRSAIQRKIRKLGGWLE